MSSSTSFGTGALGSGPLGSSPFFDCSALIDAVLYATNHTNPALETTKRRAILQFINNRYQEVCMSRHWRWLHASYDTRFVAPYTTGTASATLGSDSITGSSTVWSANLENKNLFFFTGSSVVYHISDVSADTALTLETAFSEDTIADTTYTSVQNQYILPVETDNIITMIVDSQFKMVPVGPEEFRYIQSKDPTRTDRPQIFSLMRRDTDSDRVYIEVWPAPDKAYQVHIDYTVRILRLDDSTTVYPIIPDRYRTVLYWGALAEFMLFTKQTAQSTLAEGKFKEILLRMQNDTQLTDQRLVLMPEGNKRRPRRFYKTFMSAEDFGKID